MSNQPLLLGLVLSHYPPFEQLSQPYISFFTNSVNNLELHVFFRYLHPKRQHQPDKPPELTYFQSIDRFTGKCYRHTKSIFGLKNSISQSRILEIGSIENSPSKITLSTIGSF